jgi:hypothetical protein
MNTEALFIFLILLLGLVLCSFLGGNFNKEGFDSIFDASANTVGGTSNVIGSATNSVANVFDNYNHYNGTGSSSQLQNGMVFTDASGDTVTVVTNSNGTQSLQMLQTGQTTPMVLSSTPPASSSVVAAPSTFYAPFGNITATVITESNGQTAIQFNLPNGQAVIFTQSSGTSTSSTNNSSLTSTQYYGSTGYPIQQTGNSLAYNGPYGGNAGTVTGSNGNTIAGTSSNNGYGNTYYSTMPQGIPASQIPPGQEDLYILKSVIVPPVCPACPTAASCPRQEKCPPCPACSRCPEPSFECKKVPNYNAISDDYLPQTDANSFSQFSSTNNEFLPQPVVNDFSQFGM